MNDSHLPWLFAFGSDTLQMRPFFPTSMRRIGSPTQLGLVSDVNFPPNGSFSRDKPQSKRWGEEVGKHNRIPAAPGGGRLFCLLLVVGGVVVFKLLPQLLGAGLAGDTDCWHSRP